MVSAATLEMGIRSPGWGLDWPRSSWDENPGCLSGPEYVSTRGVWEPFSNSVQGSEFSQTSSVCPGRVGGGTDQKRWPHRLMTASLAVSRQMLHSKVLSCPPLSPAPLLLPLGPPALEFSGDAEAEGPLLAILGCQKTLE